MTTHHTGPSECMCVSRFHSCDDYGGEGSTISFHTLFFFFFWSGDQLACASSTLQTKGQHTVNWGNCVGKPSLVNCMWACFSHGSNTMPEQHSQPTLTSLGPHSPNLRLCHHHHLYLNRKGCWGTTDDFTTSFLHFSLYSALWNLAKSRPVHSPMLSSHIFLCLPCLLTPLSLCLAGWFWSDLMNGRHVRTTEVCISLKWPGLRVVQLSAGSWHRLPCW